MTSRRSAKSVIPILGEISQAFGLMNSLFASRKLGNGRNQPFFEFGTARAMSLASPGWSRDTLKNTKGDTIMFAQEASNRLAAAMFSVIISAAFFAYAIIPASPSLVA